MRSVAALGLLLCATAQAQTVWKVTLLAPAGDERLARVRLERSVLGHPAGPVADALKVALAEGQAELHGVAKLVLDVVEVADAAAAQAAARKAEQSGHLALVTDLSATMTLAVSDVVTKTVVLNVGQAADSLREEHCRTNMWHLAPSDRMKADALAQTLTTRKWTQVLLLAGASALDQIRGATAQAAIKRYGLKLVASKPFKLSADPRERDLANPLLLTGTTSTPAYDVVWIVDSDGEFANSLPYRTALPRPVVGDGGLVPVAWSPKLERFGAPQVTRRLSKAVGRPMNAHDWPAYMAGRALIAAVAAQPKGPAAAIHKALVTQEMDASKGTVMTFRNWDGQLRQPIFLSDGQSVVATAPADGVMHPKNNLDTLGADGPEKLCKARS